MSHFLEVLLELHQLDSPLRALGLAQLAFEKNSEEKAQEHTWIRALCPPDQTVPNFEHTRIFSECGPHEPKATTLQGQIVYTPLPLF